MKLLVRFGDGPTRSLNRLVRCDLDCGCCNRSVFYNRLGN